MVLDYYKLREQPFGVTPDPRFLYMSSTHREALASLLYGITSGRGFMSLIAKPGMGKTTLLFQLLQKLEGTARTAFLFQTLCTPRDFLRGLLADLGVEDLDGDLVRMHSKLNEILVRQSRERKRFVVVIDEAQNFDDSVLEVVRMLSNFETPSEKLMQIVLAGQPQLADKLASAKLVQLRQRVSILSSLKPFTVEETNLYVNHRLRVAGFDSAVPMFSERAIALIAQSSEGIPRNINNLCFHAMSLGCVEKQKTIDIEVIHEVLRDLDIESLRAEPAQVSSPTPASQLRSVPLVPDAGRKSLAQSWTARVCAVAALLVVLSWPMLHVKRVATSAAAPADVPVASSVTPEPVVSASTASSETKIATVAPVSGFASGETNEQSRARTDARQKTVRPSTPENSQLSRVAPGQTLFRISVAKYGTYNDSILTKIRELNPWLSNPDVIKPGQQIRIPSKNEVAGDKHPAAEQAPIAPAAEAEKP
jgi:general secretion pathway protein A